MSAINLPTHQLWAYMAGRESALTRRFLQQARDYYARGMHDVTRAYLHQARKSNHATINYLRQARERS